MDPRFTLQAVQHVPVFYWPYVWWQLWRLRGWCENAGRDVLYEITGDGRVHVLALSDDDRDLNSWMAKRAAAPYIHLEYCNNDDGALYASAIAVFVGKQMERFGCFLRWVSVGDIDAALPAIDDSG